MDLGEFEPESQLVEMLHDPQQNSYFEDGFAAGGGVDEDVIMGDTEQEDLDDIFNPIHEQAPPSGQIPVVREETQQDSLKSVIEETQLAAIELDTQPIESEQHMDFPPPSSKGTQNMSLAVASNDLTNMEIPPPVTITREPEPPTPKFSFGKPPPRGRLTSAPSDTTKEKMPLVQQRRSKLDGLYHVVSNQPLDRHSYR